MVNSSLDAGWMHGICFFKNMDWINRNYFLEVK